MKTKGPLLFNAFYAIKEILVKKLTGNQCIEIVMNTENHPSETELWCLERNCLYCKGECGRVEHMNSGWVEVNRVVECGWHEQAEGQTGRSLELMRWLVRKGPGAQRVMSQKKNNATWEQQRQQQQQQQQHKALGKDMTLRLLCWVEQSSGDEQVKSCYHGLMSLKEGKYKR